MQRVSAFTGLVMFGIMSCVTFLQLALAEGEIPFPYRTVQIDVDGEGENANLVAIISNKDGSQRKRTIYTLTSLGDASPYAPNANDWIPITSDEKTITTTEEEKSLLLGTITISKETLALYPTLENDFMMLFRGIQDTEKRRTHSQEYNVVYKGYWLFYFDNEEGLNSSYWQPVRVNIEGHAELRNYKELEVVEFGEHPEPTLETRYAGITQSAGCCR
jgi:hypothetical protein